MAAWKICTHWPNKKPHASIRKSIAIRYSRACPVEKRSLANACFHGISPEIDQQFLAFAEAKGIYGLKGFPTIGGFRASMYNGMPIESVQYLVETMQQFTAQAL